MVGPGAGLELSNRCGVFKELESDIALRSTKGKGTTFSISLPMKTRAGDEIPDRGSATGKSMNRILQIEEEYSNGVQDDCTGSTVGFMG